jgi:hypothetical protein
MGDPTLGQTAVLVEPGVEASELGRLAVHDDGELVAGFVECVDPVSEGALDAAGRNESRHLGHRNTLTPDGGAPSSVVLRIPFTDWRSRPAGSRASAGPRLNIFSARTWS